MTRIRRIRRMSFLREREKKKLSCEFGMRKSNEIWSEKKIISNKIESAWNENWFFNFFFAIRFWVKLSHPSTVGKWWWWRIENDATSGRGRSWGWSLRICISAYHIFCESFLFRWLKSLILLVNHVDRFWWLTLRLFCFFFFRCTLPNSNSLLSRKVIEFWYFSYPSANLLFCFHLAYFFYCLIGSDVVTVAPLVAGQRQKEINFWIFRWVVETPQLVDRLLVHDFFRLSCRCCRMSSVILLGCSLNQKILRNSSRKTSITGFFLGECFTANFKLVANEFILFSTAAYYNQISKTQLAEWNIRRSTMNANEREMEYPNISSDDLEPNSRKNSMLFSSHLANKLSRVDRIEFFSE